MVFEILNIIRFTVFIICAIVVYWQMNNKKPQCFKWKYFLMVLIILTLVTHTQFYTLTENSDTISSQNIMLMQKFEIVNDRTIQNYLNENKPIRRIPTEDENENELNVQQEKSKNLAIAIEIQKVKS